MYIVVVSRAYQSVNTDNVRMFLILLISLLALSVNAKHQTVAVRGTLMCGRDPLAKAEVKLWELDTFPDPDDQLASVTTDSRGRFEIWGSENEMTKISTAIKIYHRCNNKGIFNLPAICKRKITYQVPPNYVTDGKNPSNWYDMGVINMEAKVKGEATECI